MNRGVSKLRRGTIYVGVLKLKIVRRKEQRRSNIFRNEEGQTQAVKNFSGMNGTNRGIRNFSRAKIFSGSKRNENRRSKTFQARRGTNRGSKRIEDFFNPFR